MSDTEGGQAWERVWHQSASGGTGRRQSGRTSDTATPSRRWSSRFVWYTTAGVPDTEGGRGAGRTSDTEYGA
jgi:hypothetical protein